MADLSTQKDADRKAAYLRRKVAQANGGDDIAASALYAFLAELPGDTVAGYWPIRTEIDPRPALKTLSETRRIVLPVVDGPGRPLSFRFWTPDTKMETGAYGAAIPTDHAGCDPDILIVPLAAFDKRGFRLGYGGGFYDRTLEHLRAQRPTLAVGFAYSGQETDDLPVEPTDQPLDAMVTEMGVTRFR